MTDLSRWTTNALLQSGVSTHIEIVEFYVIRVCQSWLKIMLGLFFKIVDCQVIVCNHDLWLMLIKLIWYVMFDLECAHFIKIGSDGRVFCSVGKKMLTIVNLWLWKDIFGPIPTKIRTWFLQISIQLRFLFTLTKE